MSRFKLCPVKRPLGDTCSNCGKHLAPGEIGFAALWEEDIYLVDWTPKEHYDQQVEKLMQSIFCSRKCFKEKLG